MLKRAGLGPGFFQPLLFIFFWSDLVYFLLLHFKQFALFSQPGLTLQQRLALGRGFIQTGEQGVSFTQEFRVTKATFEKARLKRGL